MPHRQQQLPIPAAWPAARPSPAEREAAAEAARVQRRAAADQLALEAMQVALPATQVDAMVATVDLDRSNVYAQRRGTRPPQLSTFVAAIRFDRTFGRAAVELLAGELGCVLVERAREAVAESPITRRNLRALLSELEQELEGAGLLPEGTDDEGPLAAAG